MVSVDFGLLNMELDRYFSYLYTYLFVNTFNTDIFATKFDKILVIMGQFFVEIHKAENFCHMSHDLLTIINIDQS